MDYTVYYVCNGIKTGNTAKILLFYSSEREHHGSQTGKEGFTDRGIKIKTVAVITLLQQGALMGKSTEWCNQISFNI